MSTQVVLSYWVGALDPHLNKNRLEYRIETIYIDAMFLDKMHIDLKNHT